MVRFLLRIGIASLIVLVLGLSLSHAVVRAGDEILYLPVIQNQMIGLTDEIRGFDRPLHLTHAGDGSGRLFVVEQEGRIRIVQQGGTIPATPFLDISDRVICCSNERGLLAVAFPPDFGESGDFYVNYTTQIDGQLTTRISRFQVGADPDVADGESEQIVLSFAQPFLNHNGGQLAFGPDGNLYIATGDGGSGGDPLNNGQSLDTLLGKILRIDVESGDPDTYTIPADNPFVDRTDARPEIWAYGLRNPWRFSFDRQTGDLWIADVGQDDWEEINYQPAGSPGGENYGWNLMEGTHCYEADTCDQTGLTLPVHEYGHDLGQSITGGFVYRGMQHTTLQGRYVYGDFISGRIWVLRRVGDTWQNRLLLDTDLLISSFGEDEEGELYVVGYSGAIYRLVAP